MKGTCCFAQCVSIRTGSMLESITQNGVRHTFCINMQEAVSVRLNIAEREKKIGVRLAYHMSITYLFYVDEELYAFNAGRTIRNQLSKKAVRNIHNEKNKTYICVTEEYKRLPQ